MLFLYARVSTADQTIVIQEQAARAAGFEVDEVIADEGVSGVSTILAERPGGKRLLQTLRRGDVLLVRWIDRLGRNYADVVENIRLLMKRGITVRTLVNSMTFDGATKDPMMQAVRDSLLSFMAAMAEMEIVARKEAMMAGIVHARADELNYIGRRPSYDRDQLNMVRDFLSKGTPFNEIARAAKLSRLTVYRIRDNYAHAEKALAKWEEWQRREDAKKAISKLPFPGQRRERPRAA